MQTRTQEHNHFLQGILSFANLTSKKMEKGKKKSQISDWLRE